MRLRFDPFLRVPAWVEQLTIWRQCLEWRCLAFGELLGVIYGQVWRQEDLVFNNSGRCQPNLTDMLPGIH